MSRCVAHFFGIQPVTFPPAALATAPLANFSGPPNPSTARDVGSFVAGYILATSRLSAEGEALGPLTSIPPSSSITTLRACVFLKMRVSSPEWNGPVWIDSDRTLALPSRSLCVDYVAPSGWLVDPTSARTLSAGGDGFTAWDVWAWVKICETPRGIHQSAICSFFVVLAAGVGQRLEIPRGARRLTLSSSDAGSVGVTWSAGSTLGGPVTMGVDIIGAGLPTNLIVVPGATHVELVGSEAGTVSIAWEVQP